MFPYLNAQAASYISPRDQQALPSPIDRSPAGAAAKTGWAVQILPWLGLPAKAKTADAKTVVIDEGSQLALEVSVRAWDWPTTTIGTGGSAARLRFWREYLNH